MITDLPAAEPLHELQPEPITTKPHGPEPAVEDSSALLRGTRIRWADAGILLSILLIGFMSYLTLHNTRQDEEDAAWVVHAQAVQKTIESAFANAVDMASAGRAFALIGQATFLDVEIRAERLLGADLDTLRQLTTDDADQHKKLDLLQQQVNSSIELTLRMEAFRERTGTVPPDADLLEGKRRIDAVRGTLADMKAEQARLLSERTKAAQASRRSIRIVDVSSALVGAGLLVIVGFRLRFELRRGTRMQTQLRRLNADLERQAAESKWAEAEAHRNELRLLGVAESSLDCLYLAEAVHDANGEIEDFVFTYVNGNALRLVTVPHEELIGGRMCVLFPVNQKIGLFEKYRQVVLTGECFVGEFQIDEVNINTQWLRIQAAKLGDGVAISASDVTHRKLQEVALRKSEALLERTERLTQTGGWDLDLLTGASTWSDQLYCILGQPADFVPTLEAGYRFYAAEDRPRIQDAVQRAIALGEPWDMECTVNRPDGSTLPARVTGEVEFEDGKPVRLVGAFRDITRRVAERSALTAAKDRLTLATDSGGIGIWDWDIVSGRLAWDHWMYRLYGMEPSDDDVVYEVWRRHVHPDDVERTEQQLLDAVKGVRPYNTEFRVVWADGSVHHIRGTGHVTRDDSGRALRVVGTNRDVTAQKHIELELARLAGFKQSIVASSPLATIVTDLQGMITEVNPAAERMSGYAREDLIGKETPLILLSPDEVTDRAALLSEEFECLIEPGMDVLTAGAQRGKVDGDEWQLIRKDGTRFHAQLTLSALTNAGGDIVGYIQIADDITERKAAQEYANHLAHHDALTGLPTRRLFRDRLDSALVHADRNRLMVGVLIVDIDHFKTVNDQMGHHTGDELLIMIANRLKASVRASDIVARMGGDEFTILLENLRCAEEAEQIAEKIMSELAEPLLIGPQLIVSTASVGITVYPENGKTAEALLVNADAAMYAAKADGRNRRQTFSRELESSSLRKRQLAEGLQHALALGEMQLMYQPQICLQTGMVTGLEALLRWQSEKLGMVSPAEFIPVAEENGMIVPIGEWVLRTACRQGKEMQIKSGRPLVIAVNISPRQFQQHNLLDVVAEILAECELDPALLELEVTENIFIGDLPQPKAVLEQFRTLGVRIALDDFGTGFSSMSYILRFKVDRLKIDQSFVRQMDHEDSQAVINAVIALAKGLNISVIAEGVETAAQRDLLLAKGCDDAQGFLYSRAVPLAALAAVMESIEGTGLADFCG